MRKCTKHWMQRDGTTIRICDMNDHHLVCAMRMMLRHAEALRRLQIHDTGCAVQFFTAEMASDMADRAFDAACEAVAEDYLDEIYESFDYDRMRRELPPVVSEITR